MANRGSEGGERELVARVLARDREAWKVFVQRYAHLLYLAVFRAMRHFAGEVDPAAVEELGAKVFSRLLEGDAALLRAFRFRSEVGAWLVLVANRVVNESSPAPAVPPGPGASGRSREEHRRVFEELAPRDRLILSMLLNSRKKNQEIAQTLNVPLKVVGMAIARVKHRGGLIQDPVPAQEV